MSSRLRNNPTRKQRPPICAPPPPPRLPPRGAVQGRKSLGLDVIQCRGSWGGLWESELCPPCLGGFPFRLKLLLNHTSILRPQYQCVEEWVSIWGTNKDITAALQDPVILQATCPFSSAGKGSPRFGQSLQSYFPLRLLLLYNPSVCGLVCVSGMCVGGYRLDAFSAI